MTGAKLNEIRIELLQAQESLTLAKAVIHGCLEQIEALSTKNPDLIHVGPFSFPKDYSCILWNGRLLKYDPNKKLRYLLKICVEASNGPNPKMDQVVVRDKFCEEFDIERNDGVLKRWVFPRGNKNIQLWGTLIKSTGGRDAKIYLDPTWIPSEEDFAT